MGRAHGGRFAEGATGAKIATGAEILPPPSAVPPPQATDAAHPTKSPQRRQRFRALDGWRGVCALMVVLFHLRPNVTPGETGLTLGSFLFVDFFFVLSGFVLTAAYADAIKSRRDVWSFAVVRFGRLWPLHMALLVPFLLFAGLHLTREGLAASLLVDHAPNPLWVNVALLQSAGLSDHLSYNYPSWSVGAEFYVNLLFALALLASPTRIPWVAAVLASIGAAVLIGFAPSGIDATFDFGVFRCLYGFFLGSIIFRWRTRAEIGLGIATVCEVAAVALVLVFVSLVGRGSLSLAAPIVFGITVWVFAREGGALSLLLQWRPFQLLGEWSYAIYMVQALVLEVFILVSVYLAATVNPALRFNVLANRSGASSSAEGAITAIVFLGVVVGTAALTHAFIERPARRWFSRISEQPGPRRLQALALPQEPAL